MEFDRELKRDEEEHLHGKCHLLAIALHRLTGLRLAATLDVDVWTERTVLVHAYVLDGDQAIDVRGRFSPETIGEDFEVNESWSVVDIDEEDLMLLGSRRRKVNESGPTYRKALFLAEKVADGYGLLQRYPKA